MSQSIPTCYQVTAYDAHNNECFNSDSVCVKYCPKYKLPNTFTPNGDGYNDEWFIRDLERYPDNEVRIINRWGDEVFYQKPYSNDWQGTWKGDNLPGATYYYIIHIHFNGQDVKFDGPLTVIR